MENIATHEWLTHSGRLTIIDPDNNILSIKPRGIHFNEIAFEIQQLPFKKMYQKKIISEMEVILSRLQSDNAITMTASRQRTVVCREYYSQTNKVGVVWSLHWRHGGVSNHQPHDCLLNRLFMLRSKKKSKLRVTGLCAGNSPVTGEFPAQKASNAGNDSISWRHHAVWLPYSTTNHLWSQSIPKTGIQLCLSHKRTSMIMYLLYNWLWDKT